MTGNSITDQLGFVTKEEVTGLPFIERPLSPMADYHQVIYKDDVCLGLLEANEIHHRQINVKRGDTIFFLYAHPQQYTLTSTFRTREKYRYSYELFLNIQITNPLRLIDLYIKKCDPVRLAIDMFKGKLSQFTSRLSQEELPTLQQALPFQEWNDTILQATGSICSPVSPIHVQADRDYAELAVFERNKRIQLQELEVRYELEAREKALQLQQEAMQREHQRQEEARKNEFQRQERTKEHINEICRDLRNTAVQILKEILQERLRESFDRGRSISEIGNEYLSLFEMFDSSFHIELEQGMYEGHIEDTHTLNSHLHSQPSTN
uniref:Uncharacterized protein n=1 Tax=Thermosporothrix sp. COM3 TaxID=2490863 RepID=A0A455SJR8_9CHLR|nr:hypothetical protein KTC_11360 [Thermosporothrix sp. COM3]